MRKGDSFLCVCVSLFDYTFEIYVCIVYIQFFFRRSNYNSRLSLKSRPCTTQEKHYISKWIRSHTLTKSNAVVFFRSFSLCVFLSNRFSFHRIVFLFIIYSFTPDIFNEYRIKCIYFPSSPNAIKARGKKRLKNKLKKKTVHTPQTTHLYYDISLFFLFPNASNTSRIVNYRLLILGNSKELRSVSVNEIERCNNC